MTELDPDTIEEIIFFCTRGKFESAKKVEQSEFEETLSRKKDAVFTGVLSLAYKDDDVMPSDWIILDQGKQLLVLHEEDVRDKNCRRRITDLKPRNGFLEIFCLSEGQINEINKLINPEEKQPRPRKEGSEKEEPVVRSEVSARLAGLMDGTAEQPPEKLEVEDKFTTRQDVKEVTHMEKPEEEEGIVRPDVAARLAGLIENTVEEPPKEPEVEDSPATREDVVSKIKEVTHKEKAENALDRAEIMKKYRIKEPEDDYVDSLLKGFKEPTDEDMEKCKSMLDKLKENLEELFGVRMAERIYQKQFENLRINPDAMTPKDIGDLLEAFQHDVLEDFVGPEKAEETIQELKKVVLPDKK